MASFTAKECYICFHVTPFLDVTPQRLRNSIFVWEQNIKSFWTRLERIFQD